MLQWCKGYVVVIWRLCCDEVRGMLQWCKEYVAVRDLARQICAGCIALSRHWQHEHIAMCVRACVCVYICVDNHMCIFHRHFFQFLKLIPRVCCSDVRGMLYWLWVCCSDVRGELQWYKGYVAMVAGSCCNEGRGMLQWCKGYSEMQNEGPCAATLHGQGMLQWCKRYVAVMDGVNCNDKRGVLQ